LHKYGGIRPAMHPRWLRCSFLKYDPIFSVVAPCHQGASPPSVRRRIYARQHLAMCGIAGRYNYNSGAPVDAAIIARMTALLEHRGPDSCGQFVDGSVGFGHRRLAVIDLSEAAAQPMRSAEGALVATYNGEVYNFQELRTELEDLGHQFSSRSDTEVILAAYRQWSVKCVERLRGMFALAIWDGSARELFLARDRAGKKPLYYRLDHNGIAFASEAKAFLAEPDFQPRVDPAAIWHYLSYQYVPTPQSAFVGVSKLPPAHYLLVRNGRVSVSRYWRLSYRAKLQITPEDAERQLLDLLEESVRLRMISDVPVGVFLSGGVDSATIAALAARAGQGRIKTFSIGFREAAFNEVQYARLVASRYDTDHHEFLVEPDAVAILPTLIWHYGEPFADSSAIPTFYLARLARTHVTVALCGDGGDENFAGYDRYRALLLSAKLPSVLRALGPVVNRVLGVGGAAPSRSWRSRAQRFVASSAANPASRYAQWMMHFATSAKNELCTPEFVAAAGEQDSAALLLDQFDRSDAESLLDRLLDVDVNHYLPDDLLVKVDVATMSVGLEARAPFLDHHVMEFAASLPVNLKLRGATGKYVLKRAVRHLVPEPILQRRKMGFGVPLEHWFRHELREMTEDVLLGPTVAERGYVRPKVVRRLVEEHVSGARSWHYQLWNLLILELWFRAFVDARPVNAPVDAHVTT
jgi:asparagine synthase (glutamine-hydrolysing)